MAGADLPDRIRRARRAADLTQKDLADLVGVGIATVQRWEAAPGSKHAQQPRADQLERLEDALGTSLARSTPGSPDGTGPQSDTNRSVYDSLPSVVSDLVGIVVPRQPWYSDADWDQVRGDMKGRAEWWHQELAAKVRRTMTVVETVNEQRRRAREAAEAASDGDGAPSTP